MCPEFLVDLALVFLDSLLPWFFFHDAVPDWGWLKGVPIVEDTAQQGRG